jgi:hypothetical protein
LTISSITSAKALVLNFSSMARFPGRYIADLVPVTHRSSEDAVEIPLSVKERMELDDDHSWIVTTEIARFAWPA